MPVAARLLLAPFVVLVATLAQRRFGHAVGGRLVGLPLTTGPFLVVLALGQGSGVAARAAEGTVSGQVSVVAFAVAYALVARRAPWQRTLALAEVAAVLVTTAVSVIVAWSALPAALWAPLVAGLAVLAVRRPLRPDVDDAGTGPDRHPPAWEVPLRALVAGGVVTALTVATGIVGPFAAGVLSTAPVIASVMGPFTHRNVGAAAAGRLMRGLVASMPGTIAFVAAMSLALPRVALVEALAVSLAALVAVDAVARRLTVHVARDVRPAAAGCRP